MFLIEAKSVTVPNLKTFRGPLDSLGISHYECLVQVWQKCFVNDPKMLSRARDCFLSRAFSRQTWAWLNIVISICKLDCECIAINPRRRIVSNRCSYVTSTLICTWLRLYRCSGSSIASTPSHMCSPGIWSSYVLLYEFNAPMYLIAFCPITLIIWRTFLICIAIGVRFSYVF